MSKWIVQKPSILDPKQISHGFVVNDGEYAAVPMGNSDTQLMVIHNGSPLKVCRNETSKLETLSRNTKNKENDSNIQVPFIHHHRFCSKHCVSFIFDQQPVTSEEVVLNQTVGYVEVSPGVCEVHLHG